MELLLLSNSTLPGEEFFAWPIPYVTSFVQDRPRIAFVPFAAPEEQRDGYVEKVKPVFEGMGASIFSLHAEKDPIQALDKADIVAVGGGNSFLLLRDLYRTGLVRAVADKVRKGLPYIGWSAGANVACPTIMTTNDMPIVETPSMRALHLIPFQINPHFTEDTIPGHGGEGREQRLAEFLALNPTIPVVGLREGSLLHVQEDRISLHGRDLKLFRHGKDPLVVQKDQEFRRVLSDL